MLMPEAAEACGRNGAGGPSVSFTSQPWNAAGYACGEWHGGEESHVYEVKPVGRVRSEFSMRGELGDPYPAYNYRSRAARVVREVPYEEAKVTYLPATPTEKRNAAKHERELENGLDY